MAENKDLVFVTIDSGAFIPFLNTNGPIKRPVRITRDQYSLLKVAGFRINLVGEEPVKCEPVAPVVTPEPEILEDVVEEATESEEPVKVDETEDVIDETVEETDTEVEADVEDDEVTTDEEAAEEDYVNTIYDEEYLAECNRKELKTIIIARGGRVSKNQSLDALRKKILDTNPIED